MMTARVCVLVLHRRDGNWNSFANNWSRKRGFGERMLVIVGLVTQT
jgi:hypothetical protein